MQSTTNNITNLNGNANCQQYKNQARTNVNRTLRSVDRVSKLKIAFIFWWVWRPSLIPLAVSGILSASLAYGREEAVRKAIKNKCQQNYSREAGVHLWEQEVARLIYEHHSVFARVGNL
jgi:hypothetical protein